jgi:hypothetical protein
MSDIVRTSAPAAPAQNPDQFGKKLKHSRLCPICIHVDKMEIQLLRSRDHLTYEQISTLKNVRVAALRIHFENHFIVSTPNSQVIALREEGSKEANELIEKVLEGDLDLFSGATGVLEAKAQRLSIVKRRILELSNLMETNSLEEFETAEFINLNKLAESIENSMFKVIQIADKQLIPFSSEERANAVLSYKLKVLTKMMDKIQITLLELERRPEYAFLINDLRIALASRFNQIEDEIVRSGGVMQATVNAPAVTDAIIIPDSVLSPSGVTIGIDSVVNVMPKIDEENSEDGADALDSDNIKESC